MKQAQAKDARDQAFSLAEERDLVERCQKGDLEAFDRLVLATQDAVFGLAYRLMGGYDDANDLAQEAFLAFFRKIGQFRGDCRVQTWLYRIVVNLAKNAWKRSERRKESSTISLNDPPEGSEGDAAPIDVPSPTPGPRQIASGREQAELLRECLSLLSPEHREAIVLRCVEGKSYEEIAEVTESALGTVKSRINRAREELRRMMEARM